MKTAEEHLIESAKKGDIIPMMIHPLIRVKRYWEQKDIINAKLSIIKPEEINIFLVKIYNYEFSKT